MTEKALVMLWHPDPPYSGGSFNSHETAFKYHTEPDVGWFVLDKIESHFQEIDNPNLVHIPYQIPKVIKFLLKRFFLLGRPLEWIYSGFALYFLGKKLIREQNIGTIYVPIAELVHTLIPAYMLKRRYGLRATTILHQFEEVDSQSFPQYLSLLRARKTPLVSALMQAAYIKSCARILGRILRTFDACGAISQYSADRFTKLFNTPFTYLEYGFDYTSVDQAGAQEKKYDAVFVARLVHFKGIEDMIHVWRTVTNVLPKATLLIIGDGDPAYVESIKNKIKEKKLTSNILFAGQVRGVEKFRLLKRGRLFLYLSHFESYAQVIDEAVASNLPIIAYDLVVYQSRLRYTNAFYFIPKGQYDKVAAKIIELLQRPRPNTVEKKFPSWQNFAEKERVFVLAK